MQENILQQITQNPMAYHQVTQDVLLLELPFVNAFVIGIPNANNGEWVLVGAVILPCQTAHSYTWVNSLNE